MMDLRKALVRLETPAIDSDDVLLMDNVDDDNLNVPAAARLGDLRKPEIMIFCNERTEANKVEPGDGVDRIFECTDDENLETERRNPEAANATLEESVALRGQARLSLESRIGDVNTTVAQAAAALRSAQASEARARLALQSTVDGENTTIAQIRAQLASAKLNLDWSTVRAPADGYAIGLSLRPGQRVAQFPVRVSVSFVETQRAVWKAADGTNPDLVMETGIYNLTQDQAEVMVRFGPEQTQTLLLVRLDETERPESSEASQ
jgi:multidrug efflux pump subunit AcrA (membrane-fusion protein)